VKTLAGILLATLAALGMPLFLVFGAATMGLFRADGNDWEVVLTALPQEIFSSKFAESPTLVTIPLFTLAGYLMAESRTPRRLVRVSRALLGWMPGGLAIVVLAASAFFTTFTGASGITIVAIGALLFPALLSEKYPERFSLGLVTTGGSLGLLFPPSLPIILYGVVGGVEVESLFLAGILPGVLTVAVLAGWSAFVGARSLVPRTPFALREAGAALWEAKWELAIPLVLFAGLGTGFLRIHEAAAGTALYVLVVEVFVYRDLSLWRDVPRVIRESMILVGAILAILACALGFTSFLIDTEVPMKLVDAMQGLIGSRVAFLVALNVFLLVVGCLMDIFSAIVVVVPLVAPVAMHFGIHPLHLGVIFLLNLEIGYLTPPVGINLFISSFRFERPVILLYRSVLPWILLLILCLLVVTYVPGLSTLLPRTFRPEPFQFMAPPAP